MPAQCQLKATAILITAKYSHVACDKRLKRNETINNFIQQCTNKKQQK